MSAVQTEQQTVPAPWDGSLQARQSRRTGRAGTRKTSWLWEGKGRRMKPAASSPFKRNDHYCFLQQVKMKKQKQHTSRPVCLQGPLTAGEDSVLPVLLLFLPILQLSYLLPASKHCLLPDTDHILPASLASMQWLTNQQMSPIYNSSPLHFSKN